MIRVFSPSTVRHPWREALLLIAGQIELICLMVKLNQWLG